VPAGRRLWVRVARQGGAPPGLPERRYRSTAFSADSDVAVISQVLDMTVEALWSVCQSAGRDFRVADPLPDEAGRSAAALFSRGDSACATGPTPRPAAR